MILYFISTIISTIHSLNFDVRYKKTITPVQHKQSDQKLKEYINTTARESDQRPSQRLSFESTLSH